MTHVLPQLSYEYTALEPWIDAQTMELHHTKHHQTYVDKLNASLQGTEFEKMSIEELLVNMNELPQQIQNAVRNFGGGHYNHSLFWELLTPHQKTISDECKSHFEREFGSLENFIDVFSHAATSLFGSGWVWLTKDNDKLEIILYANQENPLMYGKTPILGLDVWEHAYYLKYQSKRAEYVKAFWNIVNWEKVDQLYHNS